MYSISFSDWLYRELDLRNWSQRKLAQEAKISAGSISHVLNGNREPGPDLCRAIAKALDFPPDQVFRMAGLLPEEGETNDDLEQANHLLRELPAEYQTQALALIRFLHKTHVPNSHKKAKSSSS